MKIAIKKMSYEEVLKLPRLKHKKPLKPQMWLATVVCIGCTPTHKYIADLSLFKDMEDCHGNNKV